MSEVKSCNNCWSNTEERVGMCKLEDPRPLYRCWTPRVTENNMEQGGVNPKDALGSAKNPHGCISRAVLAEVGLAMMEGARKYGRHNYRVSPVRAEVYNDACNRHVDAWWEGEDIDPDSGLHHLSKAIASLFVIRDAIIQGCWYDDRPPKTPPEHWEYIKKATTGLLEKYPESKPPYTEKEHGQGVIDIDHPRHSRYCPECQEAILNAKDGEAVLVCGECTKL